jgi:predicted patatin/cPLA2 family phospholipase
VKDKSPNITELIKLRLKSNSQPENRGDEYKLGLVVEGGGMRGTVCGGVLALMEKLNLQNTIDSYYAVSAGVPATLCFVSGQAREGTEFYYQNLSGRNLVDPRQVLWGKPILKLNKLINQIRNKQTLNYSPVIENHQRVNIYATDAQTGMATRMDVSNEESILKAMYYSCYVPLAAGLPDHHQLLDGGMSTFGIPLEQAIEDDCTHVLCVLTRPTGKRRRKTVADHFTAWMLRRRNYHIAAKQCLNLSRGYNRTLDVIQESKNNIFGPRIDFIAPNSSEKEVKPHERRADKLRKGAISGFRSARQYFGAYHIDEYGLF